jgi:hypothetical protein
MYAMNKCEAYTLIVFGRIETKKRTTISDDTCSCNCQAPRFTRRLIVVLLLHAPQEQESLRHVIVVLKFVENVVSRPYGIDPPEIPCCKPLTSNRPP